MKKGARFRETPFISKNKYIHVLSTYIDNFVEKWAKKEGICPTNFNEWGKLLKRMVKTKIFNVEFLPTSQILQDDFVKRDLADLHDKYVICPIDKAGHNFAIVCKKFYIEVLKNELGVLNSISGNNVYKPVTETANDIISRHETVLKEDFNIKLSPQDKNVPLIYWISKQHKNPYKFRFISGASHCTTKDLSVELSLILKMIKQHFSNYCKKILHESGLQYYWSIDNSLQFLQKVAHTEASSIYTYDFSTLYTNLPLDDILNKLTELIIRMFNNADSHYILVNTFKGKAFWANENRKGYHKYTLQHVLDSLEFILFNTYTKFGDIIFLQTRGIPMGGNASPLIADLYLSWLEFCYLKKLKKDQISLVYELRHTSRYIDDIAAPNFNNFLDIASEIYPKEIPLEPNQSDGYQDTFLDLDIKITNGDFIFKIFHKVDLFNFEVISFPFLDSNIPQRVCYSTFFSQLIRFLRICSNISGFAERVKLLWSKLVKRNYEEAILSRYFRKFVCHYSDEIVKYGCDLSYLLQFCLDYNIDFILESDSKKPTVSYDTPCQSTSGTIQFGPRNLNNIWAPTSYRGPIALQNLGQTCYLNCVLQVLFEINSLLPLHNFINHLIQIDKNIHGANASLLLFYKLLYLCRLDTVSYAELLDFVSILKSCNSFFTVDSQRDVHEAFNFLFKELGKVCLLPALNNSFSETPEFMDFYFQGISRNEYSCQDCHRTNIFMEPFCVFMVEVSSDLQSWLNKWHSKYIIQTCEFCHVQNSHTVSVNVYEYPKILIIQNLRFSVSKGYHRNRKDMRPITLHKVVKFGLVSYKLFGVIEHHGTCTDNGHYTCFINHENCWYSCNDGCIRNALLPGTSQSSYLLFYHRDGVP